MKKSEYKIKIVIILIESLVSKPSRCSGQKQQTVRECRRKIKAFKDIHFCIHKEICMKRFVNNMFQATNSYGRLQYLEECWWNRMTFYSKA
jgi:hypothetical protein